MSISLRQFQPEEIERQIADSLEGGIQRGIFPGGICSLTVGSHTPITVARGYMAAGSKDKPVEEETIYDLASLTKVVAVLPLVLLAVQAGRLMLNDSIVTYLPELQSGRDADRKREITLYHLLTHTSGLPAWRPFYLQGRGREAYVKLIAEEELSAIPGRQAVYSDLGFMLLGFILERVYDQELDQLAKRLVFLPCGMDLAAYKPLEERKSAGAKIAPTEKGNVYEQAMIAGDPLYQQLHDRASVFAWRQELICGTVHDGNAYYGLGGVSGHAGLFASILDLQRYMQIWTDETSTFLNPVLRDFAVRPHARESSIRAIGWEASSTGGTIDQVVSGCSGGDLVSPAAYGHTGFTGTSIWHDPLRKATLITLTNRVHPTVSSEMIQWRRAHHNRIFSLVWPCR